MKNDVVNGKMLGLLEPQLAVENGLISQIDIPIT